MNKSKRFTGLCKIHPCHRVDPISRLADKKAASKHRKWADAIAECLLYMGTATTRMLAITLGCQSCDITKAICNLRQAEEIVISHIGVDPTSGNSAHFWKLSDPDDVLDAA